MSEPDDPPRPTPNSGAWVDKLVLVGWVIGGVSVIIGYAGWCLVSGHSFIGGALAFIEVLWLVVVLLQLASFDLGAWWSGRPPLVSPVPAIPLPKWATAWIPANARAALTFAFDHYIHVVGLVIGFGLGHVFWH